MRRLVRPDLPRDEADRLAALKQKSVKKKRESKYLTTEKQWNSARNSSAIKSVLGVLKKMSGKYERCMYCCDSHGTDIDHFRPKSRYPDDIFNWKNMILCCAGCGRYKGSAFPTANGQPLLIDPTVSDPWLDLDFDPDTGNITARYDVASRTWSPRGEATVKLLHLDKREALAAVYSRSFRRICRAVEECVNKTIAESDLPVRLMEADDNGLLAWCFGPVGQNEQPFAKLHATYPDAWDACVAAVS